MAGRLDGGARGWGAVPRLLDILCDLGRRKPAIVAARPVLSAPDWLQRLGEIASLGAGSASFYLLTDPDAIRAFRAEIGEEHRVATASVRTFLPEVDPAYDGWRFLPMNLQRIDIAAAPRIGVLSRGPRLERLVSASGNTIRSA